MAFDNYRDMSNMTSDLNAGFKFEFQCSHCTRTWTSPFKPYRMGQMAAVLTVISRLFRNVAVAGRAGSEVSNAGIKVAHESALAVAREGAAEHFTQCPSCRDVVCGDCYSADDGLCRRCLGDGGGSAKNSAQSAAAGAMRCPNCNADHSGGRFCAECGFDMAATHKSCPGCGAMCQRQTRFCTDCGHDF